MSRLLRRSNSNGNNTIFPCRYCLTCFSKQNLLKKHLPKCQEFKPQACKYPEPGQYTEFKNQQNTYMNNYYIVGDCETRSILTKGPKMKTDIPTIEESGETKIYQWITNITENKHCLTCKRCNLSQPCNYIMKTMDI